MKKEMTLRRNNVLRQWEIAGEKRYPILDKHNQPVLNDDGSPKEEVDKIFEVHQYKKGVLALYNRCFVDEFYLNYL
jgi:hypothetical protein